MTALLPLTTSRRPIAPACSTSSTPRPPLARVGGLRPLPRPHHHLNHRTLLCRAEGGEDKPQQQPGEQQEAVTGSSGVTPTPPPTAPKRAPVVDPSVAKGQRTAIVTGAISIVFGVIYLGLVFFMDMRGGEMLPPPPEAYGL